MNSTWEQVLEARARQEEAQNNTLLPENVKRMAEREVEKIWNRYTATEQGVQELEQYAVNQFIKYGWTAPRTFFVLADNIPSPLLKSYSQSLAPMRQYDKQLRHHFRTTPIKVNFRGPLRGASVRWDYRAFKDDSDRFAGAELRMFIVMPCT